MSASELVIITDAQNREIGTAPRSEMRRGRLWHRATFILVFDGQGRLNVQQRTLTKDLYPGWFDPAAGGVVLAGESYEQSAIRELAEEMGIGEVPLVARGDFTFEDQWCRVHGRVFTCQWDGPLVLQPEEVDAIHPMSIDEILQRSKSENFAGDSLAALRCFLKAREQV